MYKYEIIANEIRNKIKANEFKINEKLPDEKTLSNMFKCSRMTMKQAMDMLVSEGYIIKSRGIGTFVRPQYGPDNKNKRYSNHPNTFGFSSNFEGYDKKTEVKEFKVIEANEEIVDKLQLKRGEFVYSIKRVRFLNKKPIILEQIYMPIDKIVGLNKEVVENSLYDYIENSIKIKIYNADKIIRAKSANNDDINYLKIEEGDPIIEMEHVVYSQNNSPIEYAIIHYRGDSYELHFVTKKE
ncbi:GntR family transcriptional regulator [Clostridioides sp. ZZV15-6598]|uniref:GntR family transcriptional regulator n=1 Tax=Clostridioides sp. ZZV15-6598 TaxID=2811501 RepID=UPI001D0FF064|nr:GntR family transcriptional regulator [Clostridioides sp. ZZV15-6598]